MKARIKGFVVWAALVSGIAAAAAWLFAVEWWIAALLAALTINGMIATREDRGSFND